MDKINFQNGITPLNDTNLNQLQTNVENAINQKYVNITTGVEFETGRIIDGKKEYGKRIDCGKLPDNTYKDVETGLSNVNYLDWSGVATENTSSSGWPYKILAGDSSALPTVSISGNKLRIRTPSSAFTSYTGYVTFYYTKN